MTAVLQLSKRLFEPTQVVSIEQFTVRQFAPNDITAWLELRHRAFARETLGVRKWSPADFEAEFCQRWWWDPTKMWLAEAKSPENRPKLVGSVTLAMRGEKCSPLAPREEAHLAERDVYTAKPVVHWLMVAPEARRQGLARLLMSHLEAAAFSAGHREIWLETHSAWQAAARFYEALGYRPPNEELAPGTLNNILKQAGLK